MLRLRATPQLYFIPTRFCRWRPGKVQPNPNNSILLEELKRNMKKRDPPKKNQPITRAVLRSLKSKNILDHIYYSAAVPSKDLPKVIEINKEGVEPRHILKSMERMYKKDQYEEIVSLFLCLERYSIQPDERMFTYYLGALGGLGKFKEARDTTDEMLKKNISLTVEHFNSLLAAIVHEKLSSEYIDALKRMMRRHLVPTNHETLRLFAKAYHYTCNIKGMEEIIGRFTPTTPKKIQTEINDYYASLRKKLLL